MTSMLASQVVQMPISFVLNAVLARRLGPQDFGVFFFGQTVTGMGFHFVDWGQNSTIAAEVARDRSRTEALLGTSIVLKLLLGVLATGALLALGLVQGYSALELKVMIFLASVALVEEIKNSGTAILRGWEMPVQVNAVGFAGFIAWSLPAIVLILAGFGLRGVLCAAMASSLVPLVLAAVLVRRCKVRLPRFSRALVRPLLGRGSAFLAFILVLALQPYIDTAFLARLAPAEVMGWHAATRRIVGLLILPAVSVTYAMYPTLARLHHEAPQRAIDLMRGALRKLVLLGVPAAVGAVLFARPVVHVIYGSVRYDGVILNLQVFSLFIFLVYFSMVIGTSLLAADRVKTWTGVQALCLVVSAVGDAPLIGFFQGRLGNGALGVSVSNIISEVLMVAIGAALLPRQMLGGRLLQSAMQSFAGGVAMVGAALALRQLPAPIAAVASLAAYVSVLFLLGALKGEDVRTLIGVIRARAALR